MSHRCRDMLIFIWMRTLYESGLEPRIPDFLMELPEEEAAWKLDLLLDIEHGYLEGETASPDEVPAHVHAAKEAIES